MVKAANHLASTKDCFEIFHSIILIQHTSLCMIISLVKKRACCPYKSPEDGSSLLAARGQETPDGETPLVSTLTSIILYTSVMQGIYGVTLNNCWNKSP